MTTERTASCSLDAGALSARRERWRRLADRALMRSERHHAVVRQLWRARDGVEEELRTLIALEGECCPSLAFTLDREGGALSMEIRSLAGAEGLLDLFAGYARP
jgi:hypothetical protein